MRWFKVVALGLFLQSLCGCSERPLSATPMPVHDAYVGTSTTVEFALPPGGSFHMSETSTLTQVQELKLSTLSIQSDVLAIQQVIEYHRVKAVKEQGRKKGWAKKPPTKPEDVLMYQEWQQVQQVSLSANPPKL
jgi:hypothetical protein